MNLLIVSQHFFPDNFRVNEIAVELVKQGHDVTVLTSTPDYATGYVPDEYKDKLIDCYFKNKCPERIRLKIYAYVAISGLIWSNWCEYKRQIGQEFGEYSISQYRYAKEYCRIVLKELNEEI